MNKIVKGIVGVILFWILLLGLLTLLVFRPGAFFIGSAVLLFLLITTALFLIIINEAK